LFRGPKLPFDRSFRFERGSFSTIHSIAQARQMSTPIFSIRTLFVGWHRHPAETRAPHERYGFVPYEPLQADSTNPVPRL